MLSPKRTKYRKYQKGRTTKIKQNLSKLGFGRFGIKSCECWRLSARTIEAVRRVITKKLKRQGKVWTCIFPDIPVTKKPAEVRMGKGKGSINYWMARVSKGHILYEIDGVSEKVAFDAFQQVQNKLPFPVTFVKYNNL
uniref:Large ribosomal subunit protein uL16m n=1 Tax=Tetraselmis sp. CCMP 881 TaxID=1812852 RepID=A0A650AR70_9CHLO|nr:ribosomal protein L16 [Tetraselmis sp. CCMP 881]